MGWNGTSASWLGFDLDQRLCDAITTRFAVPATSAVLAINELLETLGCQRIAMITPYVDDIQADPVSTVMRDTNVSPRGIRVKVSTTLSPRSPAARSNG